jgi:prepilin-type N-terminal cleavage/methylation domain-containing protein
MSMTLRNQRGFTLAEVMVATLVTTLVLGAAVMLTSRVQESFKRQIEDSAGEQEGRYALDWVSRLIRGAGNNPFSLPIAEGDLAACPIAAGGTPYSWVIMDPDADGINDDIRLQTDSNPPDGILGGAACDQKNEDVTVSFDPATSSITFRDNNLDDGAEVRTDAVIDNLLFVFKNDQHQPTAADVANVVYVETQITVRTRTINPLTMLPETRLLTQEVRLRGRNF